MFPLHTTVVCARYDGFLLPFASYPVGYDANDVRKRSFTTFYLLRVAGYNRGSSRGGGEEKWQW